MSNPIETTTYETGSRYLLNIAFDGSNYCGWQIQPNGLAVQEVLQKTLIRIFNKLPILLIGSSRTDAGVHAIGFPASFLAPKRPCITPEKLKRALNRLLPQDIRINEITEKAPEFHTRYDAVGKAYTYVVNLGDETPFSNRFSFHPRYRFCLDHLKEAVPYLLGTHDYSAFVARRSEIDDDAIRTIYRIDVRQFERYLCLTYVGNGFLYKMVRNLTGTLLAAGLDRIAPKQVKEILERKDRTLAPETAPACGLFLVRVFYHQTELNDFQLTQVPFSF